NNWRGYCFELGMLLSDVQSPLCPHDSRAAHESCSGIAQSWRKNWRATLDLHFSCAGERTVLVRKKHFGPLSVQKALYPEGVEVCHAVLLHRPGGLAAGDDLRIDVDVGSRAHVLLTTPGATKWYKASEARPS